MKTVAKVAFGALLATALTPIGIASASGVNISGVPLTAPDPLYGTSSGENNVVNAPGFAPTGSTLYDPTGPGINENGTTPWLSTGAVSTDYTNYSVSYFYAGSESGFAITFNAPGITSFTETDKNNNLTYNNISPTPLGSSIGSGPGLLDFSFCWNSCNTVVANSSTNPAPGSGIANLIFSYLTAAGTDKFGNPAFDLTASNDGNNWFVIALNDNGGPDDNHDDMVVFAHVVELPGGPNTVPLPGALPLFGSVVGAGLIALRKRRKKTSAA